MSLNKMRGESSERSMFPMYRVGMARSVSGEVSASDKIHHRRQKKQSTLCTVVLLVALVLVVVGITLALVLTLLPSRREETPGVVQGPAVIELSTSLMQNFTEDLYDESSQAYQDLAAKFTQGMYDLLSNATSPDTIVTIKVTGFRNGSVKVCWELTVTQLPDGVTDDSFQTFLSDTVRDGIGNGILQGLPANTNSVIVIRITYLTPDAMPSPQSPDGNPTTETCADNPCQGGGSCQDIPSVGFICTCPPGLEGSRCEQVITCPALSDPENGVVTCTMGNNVSSRCSYSCNDGLLLVGNSERTCREDRQWLGVMPTCEAPRCELLPEVPGALMSCSRANAYRSVCLYMCMNGFTLESGGSFVARLCLADGQWTNSQPSCISTGCPTLRNPSNGAFSCTSGSNFGSVCTLACAGGYRISSVFGQVRQCQTSGRWSGSVASCLPSSCPALDPIPMGSISCTDGSNFLSTCTYSCMEGFILNNFENENRLCGSNGIWSGVTPTCIRSDTVITCPPLAAIPFGEVVCSNGNLFESTCEYSCQLGYAIPPGVPNLRTCGATGVWSGPEPFCIDTITCPVLSAIPDGFVTCSDSNRYRSLCNYSCRAGYSINDDNLSFRECQLDGTWTGMAPMCVADIVFCPVLENPSNGFVTCSNGEAEGSTCVYSCESGYILDTLPGASPIITCGSSGQWIGNQLSCVPISCPVLPDVPNGSLVCDQGFTFGSTCVFSCDDGFTILGMQGNSRSCGANGLWTLGNPVCVPVTCPNLPLITDGSFTCDQGLLVGSQCVYQCNVGFTFVTEQTAIRSCGNDGQWTGAEPVCTAITCDVLPDVLNGNIMCTNENIFDSLCQFTCNDGFNLVGVTARACQSTGLWSGTQPTCVPVAATACPTLPSIENAILDCSAGSDIGSVCTYTCMEGFTPVSGTMEGSIRVCGIDGQWSRANLACTEVRCPTLSILQGSLSCTNGNFYLSVCRYTCNPGFSIPADQRAMRTCQADGTWTGSEPQCLFSLCQRLSSIPNAQIMCSNGNNAGSTCTYVCDSGFEIIGQPSVQVCMVDGSWSGQPPTCIVVSCNTLPQIANAVLSCPLQPVFQQTCTYRCNTGYRITPTLTSFTLTCLASGQWDNFIPTCTVVTCPLLSDINFGSVSCTNANQYLSSCTYQCEAGYNLVSAVTRVCQASGVWSGQQPVCSAVSCDPLPQIPNGQVNCPSSPVFQSTCTYTCNLGFNLSSGTATFERTCTASGQWDNFTPVCRVVTCPPLFNIDQATLTCTNTNLYESICSYTCNTGFTLAPEGSRICQASGLWTGDEQECIESMCPPLPAVSNGQIQCTQGNVIGTFCTYSCDLGFQLVPIGASRTCLQGGQWSGSDPICQIGMCEDLTGSLNAGTVTCTNGNNFQSQCTLSCLDGFVSSTGADSVLFCGATGVWSGIRIVCFAVQCPDLAPVEFSTISCTSGAVLGSTCTYTCLVGYNLVGNADRTCIGNGIWSGQPPVCSLVTCPSLPTVSNGAVTCSDGFNFNSECTYTCATNFVVSGSDTRSCQADGSWSGSQPDCAQVTCPSLTAVANGGVPECTNGFAAESVCTYVCNPGYEIGTGQSSRTCSGTTQTWSGTEPTCVQVTCPTLSAVTNGMLPTCNGVIPGSTCTYECNIGFTISSGSASRTCQDTGLWTGTEPICVLVTCPTLTAVTNGMVPSCNGFTFGSTCIYECNVGFTIASGSASRICGDAGSWTGSEPTCARAACPVLMPVTNGITPSCTNGFLPGSVCTYQCDIGYEIVSGSTLRTCNGNTFTWSGLEPTCSQITCPPLSAVTNGETPVCSSNFAAGSVCMYQCSFGFQIGSGSTTRTCNAITGAWSGVEPTCEQIVCPPLSAVANSMEPSCTAGFLVGSFCTYECNVGYEIGSESSTRVCNADTGSWSGVEPVCVQVFCSSLQAVSNGQTPTCSNGFAALSTCTYRCVAGFEIGVGSESRTCDPDSRTWSGVEPTCVAVTCSSLPAIANGMAPSCTNGNNDGSVCTYQCNTGFEIGSGSVSRTCSSLTGDWSGTEPTCVQITCPNLATITNGVLQSCTDAFNVASICTYVCNSGFRFEGGATQTCIANGQWSLPQPSCVAVTCPNLAAINNGVLQSCTDNFNVASICTYVCNVGFRSQGGATQTCGTNGEWSLPQPSCLAVTCPTLSAVTNGMLPTCNGVIPGSTCTYECNIGFTISSGSASRTCQDTGLWTGTEPICVLVTCPTLIAVTNGMVPSCNGFTFGSTCIYECNVGFTIASGSASRICGDAGSWTGSEPTCARAACPVLMPVTNGITPSCTNGFLPGSVCTYQCDIGYEIVSGSTLRTCNGNTFTWSGLEPTCSQITCPPLSAVTNGETPVCSSNFAAGSVCMYQCSFGFQIGSGSTTRTCNAITGAWSGVEPTCEQIVCPPLSAVANSMEPSCTAGFLVGSFCTYECNVGYEIGSESSTRVCNADTGSWSGVEPVCVQVFCSSLQAVSNGQTPTCSNGFAALSTCTYRCVAGFEIGAGSESRTCDPDSRTWSGVEPTCVAVTCSSLPAITNGMAPSCTNGNNDGSLCTYQCNTGFEIGSGSVSRTCSSLTGAWSGTEPTCVQITCPNLATITNGVLQSCTDALNVASICTYICNSGFRFEGGATQTCIANGQWSLPQPSCVAVTCPNLAAINNGVLQSCTDNFNVASICTYVCNVGFRSQGGTTQTCGTNGEWSLPQPSCVAVTCPNLATINNGVLMSCTNSFNVASICTYVCNSGFRFEGAATQTCGANGQWSLPQPSCVAVTCPTLSAIDNGVLQSCTDNLNVASVCTYVCNVGFRSQGGTTQTCGTNGEWSLPQPSCVAVTCPNLATINNGVLMSCTNSFNVASICTYVCNSGFRFEGAATQTCGANGQWSLPQPSCVAVTCPTLSAIDNGVLQSCTDNLNVASVCTYVCNAGFSFQGGATQTCSTNGQWSLPQPSCVEDVPSVICDTLQNIANAALDCTNDNVEGSTCTYTCNSGWALATGQSGSRVCSADGTWTGEAPTCEIICGSRPAFIETRIVNGDLSQAGAWPWLVSIRSTNGNHQCGGVLIDPEWVLTAAHCIVDTIATIVAGDLLLDTQTANHQEFEILDGNTFPHPDYNDFSQRNDIALIKLPQPAVYNDYVRPICLNTIVQEETTFDDCFVAGWGLTMQDGTSASNELYEARVPFFDRGACEFRYFIVGITENQFCAGYPDNDGMGIVPDACQGDSGGPYMCYDQTTDTWTDVGVVSFGVGCGRAGIPGVYARISMYLTFINGIIATN